MKGKICMTDDVRAILDGRKTMFREPLKPQPTIDLSESHQVSIPCNKAGATLIKFLTIDSYIKHKSPYHPGDIIYVREAWYEGENFYGYKADFDDETMKIGKAVGIFRSPATMPREAARIFLRVTDVRVERVQEITAEGVWREGINVGDVPEQNIHKLVVGIKDWDKLSDERKNEYFEGWARTHYIKCIDKVEKANRAYIAGWNARYPNYPYESNPWTVGGTFEQTKEGLG